MLCTRTNQHYYRYSYLASVTLILACSHPKDNGRNTYDSASTQELSCFDTVNPEPNESSVSNIRRCIQEYHNCALLSDAYQEYESHIQMMSEIEFSNSTAGCRAKSQWDEVLRLQQLYGDEYQRIMMFDANAESEPTPFLHPISVTTVDHWLTNQSCSEHIFLSTDGYTAMRIAESARILSDTTLSDLSYTFSPLESGWSTDLCRAVMVSRIANDFNEHPYPPTVEGSCWSHVPEDVQSLEDIEIAVELRYAYTKIQGDPLMLVSNTLEQSRLYSEWYDDGIPLDEFEAIEYNTELQCQ